MIIQVLRRLPASKRGSFVSAPFEAALDRALTCVDHHTATQQAHDNAATEPEEGQAQPEKDKGKPGFHINKEPGERPIGNGKFGYPHIKRGRGQGDHMAASVCFLTLLYMSARLYV